VTLKPGDALILYTDGLIERNPCITGEQDLARLTATVSASTAAKLLSELEHAALGPAPHRVRDDVAILVLAPSPRP
jgi:serine phosphatase RsbU (regulator of sigma subunit)